MKLLNFLNISSRTTLKDLSNQVGVRNVDSVLHLNNLPRLPKIGEAFDKLCKDTIDDSPNIVDWQRKSTILNSMVGDSDVFEYAALASETTWKLLDKLGTFPKYLKLPETVGDALSNLTGSVPLLGNGIHVQNGIYAEALNQLQNEPHVISPQIFNEYSSIRQINLIEGGSGTEAPMQWFPIPWGSVSLYTSIDDSFVNFPVYPEEVSDGVHASYNTMPDLIYQYEPWQLYTGSGPRSNTYEFEFHRDMWTGDHRDGKANELIRFCMANCYADFKGSIVNIPTVSLYVNGELLISGVMTDVETSWSGPLGLDGWYLYCKLSITIIEVSKEALNFTTMRRKPLIG